jgi:hypothetical protein
MAGFFLPMPEHRAECGQMVGGRDALRADTYETVTCTACGQLHFVHRGDGQGAGDERK